MEIIKEIVSAFAVIVTAVVVLFLSAFVFATALVLIERIIKAILKIKITWKKH